MSVSVLSIAIAIVIRLVVRTTAISLMITTIASIGIPDGPKLKAERRGKGSACLPLSAGGMVI